jgi:hypothetical protein
LNFVRQLRYLIVDNEHAVGANGHRYNASQDEAIANRSLIYAALLGSQIWMTLIKPAGSLVCLDCLPY